jgi:hypothetical protein
MADYRTLIKRAIERGDSRTGEARRAVYEKARTALIKQLRGLDPPLGAVEIFRQHLALEDVIRKVEAEMAEALVRDAATALSRLDDPQTGPEPRVAAPKPAAPPAPDPSSPAAQDPLRPKVAEAQAPAPMRPMGSQPRPPLEPVADRPAVTRTNPLIVEVTDGKSDRLEPAEQVDAESAADETPPPRRLSTHAVAAWVGLALLAALGVTYWQYDPLEPATSRTVLAPAPPAPPSAQQAAQVPAESGTPSAAPITGESSGKFEDRLPQEGLAPAAPGPSGQQTTTVPATTGAAVPAGPAAESAPRPTDSGAAAPGPVVPVAQRAVLYEEGGEGGSGTAYAGTVSWRTEADENASPGLLVRGLIEVPDRGLKMLLTFRRNADPALPASHTIELLFEVPAGFQPGGIANVPGILMKASEPARGMPLAGASARVTNGYFLVGLSSAEVDRKRNLQLLRERSWIDVPILYDSNRRAILTVDKGVPGERAFEQAFASWPQ